MLNVGIIATRRPSGGFIDLVFTGGALPSDIAFYRASSGTRFTSAGLMETKSSDVARFDHKYNAVSGLWEPRGLLIEPSRTNLIYPSVPSTWTVTKATITTNAATAPDGTTSASLLTDDAVGGTHSTNPPSIYFASGTTYTYSAYLKAGTEHVVQIIFGNSTYMGTGAYANFDLSTGVAYAGSGATATIKNEGNGWYRCSITATAIASGNSSINKILFTNNNTAAGASPVYPGTGLSYYAWGAQVEEGSSPSSYIPTSGSAVTRAVDQAYSDALSWFDPTGPYTVAVDFNAPYTGSTYRYGLGIDDGTGSITDVLALGVTSGNLPFVGANISGTTYLSGNGSSVSQGSTCSVACTISPGANLFSANGATLAAGTLAAQTIPTSINRLVFGDRTNSDRTLGSCIKRFRKLKTPITDQSALNALTVVT